MAAEIDIGGDNTLFVGEDKTFELELIDENGDPVNMAGLTLLFDVRKKDNSPDPAIMGITPTLVGVFNVVRASNTQRALALVTDTQMNLFRQREYRYSWKVMSFPETVVAFGDFLPQKATAP